MRQAALCIAALLLAAPFACAEENAPKNLQACILRCHNLLLEAFSLALGHWRLTAMLQCKTQDGHV